MTNYNERLDGILEAVSDYEYFDSQKGMTIAEAKQAITSLIKELIGDDEKVPESIFDYSDDDQRKYWYNKLRAELREKVSNK